ncbi:hypothetical protein GCM10025759_11260 [Lysobacter panacisoli]|uniref:P/Homo B domain-containing protein n=1 Tax=Lysobacter panacisoli TaxID=1255263 RepID=A0ABP9LA36_9GAMM
MNRKTSMTLRLVGLTGALMLSGAALAAPPLFLGPAQVQPDAGVAASRLAARPATTSLRALRADAAVVDARNAEIELDLGLQRVNAVLEQARTETDGSVVWTGHVRETAKARPATVREVRHDENNSVILVRRGQGVTGNVRVNGQLYRIRPLPDGSHAVIEVNEAAMPPDHPTAFGDLPQIQMAQASAGRVGALAIDPGPTATIRVLVVATNNAVSAYGGDMQALVQLAVAESNQGYVNSNVGINMELAGYTTVAYSDVGMSTDLSRFRGTSDGYMDTIHALRDSNAADVAVLVGNDSSACGLASGIGSTATTAFATAYWDCITGYYSFAHEIGHLQSARHDPATDPTNSPYVYGHGYRAPNNAWRTIMAYTCSPSCPRLNYWSNPDVTYNGVAMGTTDRSHNQRVLVNTKATIAAFRGGGGGGGTQTYSNGTDVAIGDNTTVESPVTVSGRSGNAPTNASVTVAIVHTYQGDLKVDLVAPDGSLYNIHNRTGGSTDNVNKTVTLNLSSEPLNGTWKLRVNDNAAGDTGYINSWSVTF